MPNSIRQDFGNNLAKVVLDEIQFQRARYYYFLGGLEPWNGVNGVPSGDIVSTAAIPETEETNRRIRSEMIFAKKIQPNETSLVMRRIPWQTGVGYDQWDHTIDMRDKNFYVVNTNNRVFKCLYNNTPFGATAITPSTVEPTGTSIYPFTTSDGYRWKYMYTISPYSSNKFSSFLYTPVQRALSDSFYNNGAVDDVVVLSTGSGYTDSLQTSITIIGTTTGSGAVASFTTDVNGVITGVTVDDGGSGYTKGVRLTITSATGAGAVLTPTIVAGVITNIAVTQGGINYEPLTDSINFLVGGAVLVPSISRVTGSITNVTIVDGGVGYVSAPTLVVAGTGGTGLYGNPTALISAIEYNGSIVHVNIQDPGQDYPYDNDTIITVQGDGTGAVFSPVIYNGGVVDVVVEDPGSGYTTILLSVVGNGTGAQVQGVITQSDYVSDQSVIEQTSVEGAIYAIKVSAGGSGYSSQTTATITGNGTGCTATTVVEAGVLKKIIVTNFGSGYTWAQVTITDPTRATELIPVQDRAAAYAILPPIGGHGKDAPLELYSDTLAVNTSLRNEMEIQAIVQDFRTFGILKDPKNLFTGANYNVQSAVLLYKMQLLSGTDTSGLIKDEILVINNNKYRVVDYDSTYLSLSPIDNITIIPLGTLTSQLNTSRTYTTTTTLSAINMNKYSGTLLYVSTENPFEFSETQSITVKTFIKF